MSKPATTQERARVFAPTPEDVQTEAEKVLAELTPTSVLDDMTVKVVGSLMPNLRRMTVDQRIRLFGPSRADV